jgi:L-threonylcarbamoyladenylate synthase
MYDIDEIVDVVRHGGVILYPADTIWGIGCDACCHAAVQRVHAIKRRSTSKSFIVLASDEQMLERYVGCIPLQVRELLNCPEPLTIIYPHSCGFAQGVCASDGSVAARIPRHAFCQKLIAALGRPIVSTSANISGSMPAACLPDVEPEITLSVDMVVPLKYEGTPTRKPSRIARLTKDEEVLYIR